MNFAPFWGATRHWENDKMDVVRVEDGEGLQRHKSGQISHCKQENRWTGWIWPIPGRGGGFDVPWGRYLPGHGPTQAKKWSCASFPKAPECLWTSAQGVLATYRQAGLSSSNNSACWAKQDGADEMSKKKKSEGHCLLHATGGETFRLPMPRLQEDDRHWFKCKVQAWNIPGGEWAWRQWFRVTQLVEKVAMLKKLPNFFLGRF